MPALPPSTRLWKLLTNTNSHVPIVHDVKATLLNQLKLRLSSCSLPMRCMSLWSAENSLAESVTTGLPAELDFSGSSMASGASDEEEQTIMLHAKLVYRSETRQYRP